MPNIDSPTISIEAQAVTACIMTNKEKVTEGTKEDFCEMTAAAALTSLVDSPNPSPMDSPSSSPKALIDEEDGEEEDDDDEARAFSLPQRYTRSGRKRAVSFPLKVSPISQGQHLPVIVRISNTL
jgi:hypothetical protein